ncbi:MAG: nucleoside hydrolase, partial [Devosia sp.]|nr:nucleoside hydrolase [Devosia sp.]
MSNLPREKRARLILNTDAKNEADDQFTIVHALLTPTFDFHGIIAAHFGDHRSKTSMEDSRAEIDHLLKLMDLSGCIPVASGASKGLPDENTPVPSLGAQLIVDQAMSDDDRPLHVAFLGPLTDMASALLMEPRLNERNVI